MIPLRPLRLAALPLLFAAACEENPPPPPSTDVRVGRPQEVEEDADHAGGGATLRAIMAELGDDMENVHEALWVGNFARLAAAAREVADHPHVSPEEQRRIQGVLQAEFADFASADQRVHDASVALEQAALARDTAAVLDALDEVQRGCVSCHTRFRERLRAP